MAWIIFYYVYLSREFDIMSSSLLLFVSYTNKPQRGVPCIRYADDIVLLAKSKRASERLLESSTKFFEGKLKLTVNREKSCTVSVFAIRNFKFLGFALGRNGGGIYVRVHPKSWKKFKSKLKDLSSRRSVQSTKPSLERIKVYARGWFNY